MNDRLSEYLDSFFEISEHVRYAAIYHNGDLAYRQREGLAGASSSDSDKYEELIANPVLLKTATQRGDIDCGGLEYVLVRYGNFFQFVTSISGGHVSVCIALEGDPLVLAAGIRSAAKTIEQNLN